MQLCVLIDRGHRELPVEAAFVGRKVPTTSKEIIEVKLIAEIDDAEKVLLIETTRLSTNDHPQGRRSKLLVSATNRQ